MNARIEPKIPQHSSVSNEYFTPLNIVRASRTVLGGRIDLDPASCKLANRRIKAARFIGLPDDGLTAEWLGTVFLNPPGGTLVMTKKLRETLDSATADSLKAQWTAESHRWGTRSRACAWWRKLTEEHRSGRVPAAIFIGFTLELLRSAQGGGWKHPFDFSICVPPERIQFGGSQPTHGNVIVYLGPDKRLFRKTFKTIGRVK